MVELRQPSAGLVGRAFVGMDGSIHCGVASPEPRPDGAVPDFNAYDDRRERNRCGAGRLRPAGFISGGCLKVRTIYFPKPPSGDRDAGLFLEGQC
jgi:hypothetical protein